MLKVTHLSKTYGSGSDATTAIGDVSFEVSAGEFVCIVGPSGCGKTTLLKTISGLMRPTSGDVMLNDEPIVGPPEKMALVLQDYSRSLYPWMRVRDNVAFPLRRKRLGKRESRERVEQALASVGLSAAADKFPWQLSGGMQQRASIARALSFDPKLLLMDEPFGALDEIVRDHLNGELLRIWAQTGKTILFVTHSIPEAVFLSTRIVVMSPRPGRIIDVIDCGALGSERRLEIRETPEFLRIAHRVREGLRAGHSYED